MIELDNIYNMDCLDKWADVNGFEGKYKVSRNGDIFSIKSNKILKPILSNGYLKIMLGRKMYRIHRLVAFAYIPNPQNYTCINHKNGDKKDNRVENLEWCNHTMNLIHAYRNGLNKNERPVERLLNDKVMASYRSAKEAEKDGFQCRLIAKCCKGKRKHHGGFEWRYADRIR